MELLAPTTIMSRGATLLQSTAYDRHSFRYMALPIAAVHLGLRFIGGSSAVPLFVDDNRRMLVVQRLASPIGGLLNATLPQLWLDATLPQGLEPRAISFGIFALGDISYTTDQSSEFNNIRGVILITPSSIFGMLVSASGVPSQWNMTPVPFLRPSMRSYGVPVLPKSERIFISALSLGGLTYFLDESSRLSSCYFNIFGEVQMDEIQTHRGQLLNQNTRTLKSWLLHFPTGGTPNTELVCLRYEHTRPSYYFFRAYEISLLDGGCIWRSCRDLRDCCFFIGWGSGAQAFAYWHPERVGLTRGRIYDSRRGFRSYHLNHMYQDNIMQQFESLTWPFPLWLLPSFSIPYVSPPRYGPVADALIPPPGTLDDGGDSSDVLPSLASSGDGHDDSTNALLPHAGAGDGDSREA